ncbi:MAG: DUF1003 domain-containing protein [Acidobacteriaceae bacterium]|nr:DUF1003 domain-containing protein [Acidobacteriaceae bacterium]
MNPNERRQPVTSKAAGRNISRIAELEADFEEKRTRVDRVVSRIADWTGSLPFINFHLIWFLIWVVINATSLFPLRKFDPYPFVLLSVAVSCEAVLLSTIVLIKQNWMSRRDERRDQLHLQINLLAEQEATKILFLQRLVCKRFGIAEAEMDPEIADLSQETAVEHLAEQLSADKPIK